MNLPEFKSIKERNKFLVENKDTLIAQKKAQIKHADAFMSVPMIAGKANKAEADGSKTQLWVKAAINSTNLMDSHLDVHLGGLWDKSLQENKRIMHLQEHKMGFEYLISKGEDLKAYTQNMTWGELGYNFEGNTEVLVFESTVKQSQNQFMFEQYSKGNVDQHSVGMYYVKLALALNDDNYGSEFEVWEKYYPEIANKEFADDMGMFWAVREAKVIEGSSVLLGSNGATPTLDTKQEPPNGTQQQPEKSTVIDFGTELQTIKFF